jgi:hypothetical protein
MFDFWLKGYRSETPKTLLPDTVIICNQIAAFGILLNVIGIIASLAASVFFIPLFFISILALVGVQVLNQSGKYQQGKILLSANFIGLPYLVHIALINNTEKSISGISAIMMMSWMIPWWVFRLRDWRLASVFSVLGMLLFWITGVTNQLIDVGLDSWILRQDLSEKILFSIAGIISISLIALVKTNFEQKTLENSKTAHAHKILIEKHNGLLIDYETVRVEKEAYRIESLERKWLVETLSLFNSLFRQYNDEFDRLCDELVSNLSKQINACQVFLFLTKEQKLVLTAAYAYERKKYLNKEIELNKKYADSLLTQAYLTKEEVLVENIPNGYTELTSGLGEFTPQNLLIAPIKIEDSILGVIEIASFHKFSKNHRELVSSVCDAFSYVVFNKFSVLETQQLLATLQEQRIEFVKEKNSAESELALEIEKRNDLNKILNKIENGMSNFGLAVLDKNFCIQKISPEFKRKTANELIEPLGQSILEILAKNEIEKEKLELIKIKIAKSENISTEQKFLNSEGKPTQLKTHYIALKDKVWLLIEHTK